MARGYCFRVNIKTETSDFETNMYHYWLAVTLEMFISPRTQATNKELHIQVNILSM